MAYHEVHGFRAPAGHSLERRQKPARFRGRPGPGVRHDTCVGRKPEATMSPFLAALIACAYMAAVFVLFGLVPQLRNKHH
jgi:hypothetical protein